MKNETKNKIITGVSGTVAATALAFLNGVNASADEVKVQEGDTLKKLAAEHNTTVEKIAADNNITNVNLIFAGSSLDINETATGLSADGTSYTVQTGDTLSKIAEKTNVPAGLIASINQINNPDLIVSGQTLSLKQAAAAEEEVPATPVAAESQAPAATESAASTPVAAPVQQAPATQAPQAATTADATINAWNVFRAKLGLRPISISANLTNLAQSRANNYASNSNWFGSHLSSQVPEVVANGFAAGNAVINAWYNETGMINGGHTAFIINPNFTQAGVGYSNGWIVINAQ
ncbi:MAG: LysM peptidoglycan-binding domain-containing protein [Lactobacillaceae bacterium]|jgi:LysM repeat protein|nr:LysM peptidoglycan-binding domain-containing protein [Lactobacillaceae bacterium]